jgi:hypothetical protein
MRRAAPIALALVALAVSGCAANVPIILDFPTTRAFEISENVRIDVVRIAPDALGSCPMVLTDAMDRPDTLDIAAQLDLTNVCEAQAGIALPDPGSGALAFVAQVVDDSNRVILAGCTVAEAYPGSPPVRIELHPTASYTMSATTAGAGRAGSACGGGS